ncbi:MAG: (Fe-S)-binding protein [Acidobacteria bacterium]|nr:(Fe-S)-binding protein [Acidobacteriota bacterium]
MSHTSAAGTQRTTELCRYCWMCRHVCPVGRVTAQETHTPHAWALTIESVRRGQIAWTADSVDVLFACADCGLCQTHCVTGQPLPDAIVQARAEVVAAGDAPAGIQELAGRLQRYGNAYVEAAPKRGGSVGRTALFAGDVASALRPAAIDAAVRLLAAAGIDDVVVVARGRSSGLLASSVGLTSLARSLAREVVDDVQTAGAHDLLVLSAADRWTFDYVYPRRLGVTWPDGVHALEVATVLARAHAEGRLTFTPIDDDVPFGYHDPCHAPRVRHDPESPRALAGAALGARNARELFWRERRAHPCGAIGGLEYTHPEVSRALAEARLGDARAAGVGRIVTEDPACAAQLARHAGDVDVVSLYELLDERLVR